MKKLIGLVIVFIILVSIMCTYIFLNKKMSIKEEYISDPEKIVEYYINNFINKKYEDNYKYVYIIDDEFITKDDYIEYINANYENVYKEKKFEKIEEFSKTETEASYVVFLKTESDIQTLGVKLKMLDDKWKIVEDDFYVLDWSFVVPKDAIVMIDNKEESKKYITEDNSTKKYQVKYVLPAIASTKKKFVFKTKIGASAEEIVPTTSNNKQVYGIIVNDKELINRAHDFIKDSWNSMYNECLNNVDNETVKEKYFDSSINIEICNILKKLATNDSDHKVLEVISRPNTYDYSYGDDIIALNFGYKISWLGFNKYKREMTRWGVTTLKIEGNSFKIYDGFDLSMFVWVNESIKDY